MKTEIEISKLTLGTVQLGLPYGIANKGGQPDLQSSHQLLQFALKSGINTLDTARDYGEAEDVIGSFPDAAKFNIVSKFKLSDAALQNKALAIQEATASVEKSCKTLKIDKVPVCLLHKNMQQDMEATARMLPQVLDELEKEGLIATGGISVYTPQELQFIRNWDSIRAVQVPVNVFDTRVLQNNIMQTLIDNNVNVFARSVYLQGLVVMAEDNLPSNLSFTRPFLSGLREIAAEAGLSAKEFAFAFVRDMPGITSLVVGVETISQIQENVSLLQLPTLSSDIYLKVREQFLDMPVKVITPALWNN
ncbi:MAG TPA: aldo/keto reductase [Sphingobacteriaceae bacterium]